MTEQKRLLIDKYHDKAALRMLETTRWEACLHRLAREGGDDSSETQALSHATEISKLEREMDLLRHEITDTDEAVQTTRKLEAMALRHLEVVLPPLAPELDPGA